MRGSILGAAVAVVVVGFASSASAQKLLQEADLEYLGSFRLPTGDHGTDHFDYSSGFVAGNVYYDAARGNQPTLFVSGYLSAGYVSSTPSLAQISIPGLADPNTVGLDGLQTATILQGFADPSDGKAPLSGNGFCSYVVYQGSLIGACSVAYDASGSQPAAAFVNGSLDFAKPSVSGPYPVGNVSQTLFGSYMTLVPPEWQSALGAPVVAGNGPWSIISVNSAGPGLHTLDADALIAKPAAGTTIASKPLAYYPCTSGDTSDQANCHQTLGAWDSNLPTQTWNGTPVPTVDVVDPQNRSGLPVGSGGPNWTIPYNDSSMRILGALFADGTRSVLFFGKKGLGPYCYGPGTSDPSLVGKPAPGGVDDWCFDPDSDGKGDHAYPYSYFVWAYDVNDYVAVLSGSKKPWEVAPYTGWTFTQFGDAGQLGGVAWDPSTRRMYLVAPGADAPNYQPLVHVYSVSGETSDAGTGGGSSTDGGAPGGAGGGTGATAGNAGTSGSGGSSASPSSDDSGCGCKLAPTRAPSSLWLLALSVLVGLASFRRRA